MKNNTRRIAAAVLAFCITAGTMPAMNYRTLFPTAYAAEEEGTLVEKDGMLYTEFADHIVLYYCEPDGDTLNIPDTIDGKPVTEIGEWSFSAYPIEGLEVPLLPKDLKKVYIPDGVEVIGDYAFDNSRIRDDYNGIFELYLPSTLKKVGENAFGHNLHLNVFGLPENVELGKYAFDATHFDVEKRSNTIEKDGMIYEAYEDHIVLYYCEPDGDTLNIPDTIDGKPVTEIGEWAFSGYPIEGIEVPELPTNVNKVYIPEGVEVIGDDAFMNRHSLDDNEGIFELYLPSTLKKVGEEAFDHQYHMHVFGISETVELDEDAFSATDFDAKKRADYFISDEMIYVAYPDHVEMAYCKPDGDTIRFPDTMHGKPVTKIIGYIDRYPNLEIPALTEDVKKMYIPEGVEEIDDYVFKCPYDLEKKDEGLYELYLPSTLKKVGEEAFGYHCHLNVFGLPETAECGKKAFARTHFDAEKQAYYVVTDEMKYLEYSDHIEMIYCEPDGDTLSFPDTVNGKPVTKIISSYYIAYKTYFCFSYEELPDLIDGVKKIYIPEGVEEISDYAFTNWHKNFNKCVNVYELYLPSTLKRIGEGAFEYNKMLKVFGMPEEVEVGKYAFDGTPYEGKFSTAPTANIAYGDANLDGKVTLADSLAILQFIANEDKYPLSAQAQKNADCYNPGDGITGNDAVAVMRYDTKVVSKLPIIEK